MPMLWRDLDLSRARRKVGSNFINKCFKFSHHTIEKAFIGNVDKPEAVVEALTKKCHTLSSLILTATALSQNLLQALPLATNLTHLSIKPLKIRGTDVRQLLRRCPNLTSFECTGLESDDSSWAWDCLPKGLTRLTLEPQDMGHIACLNVGSILAHGTQLVHLDVENFYHIDIDPNARLVFDMSHTKLESLAVRSFDLPLSFPRSLKRLRYHAAIGSLQNADVRYHLPNLEIVECSTAEHLFILLENPADPSSCDPMPLVSVKMHTTYVESEAFARAMRVPHCRLPKLRELVFKQLKDTDDAFVPIITQLKSLERLSLSSSDITGYGVKRLITELPLLKHLDISGCKEVFADAIAWARGSKTRVICTDEPPVQKGRRVRFDW